ncbi:MAG: adenylate/guanylate cyclase domain-containing protein [Ignavibacteriaceae bacterium]|nr:adenylate/guanylate cyclase domain-containing protein [Ignavibacteriaceae bacterium]
MEKPCRILIAEDEAVIAIDIAKTLEKLSYKVIGSCRNGREVIQKAVDLKPDLILMDVMLDGKISGIDAAEEIMNTHDIPVIYLTAYADTATLEKAKLTEPFGYILKPYDERTLHTSIEMALYKHDINKKLKERTQELKAEKEKSDLLLQNILPIQIIKELKEKGVIKPRDYECVSLLFTDFEGFTRLASNMPPGELVAELNEIFMNFDKIINKYGLEKLKTIGDSYMVGGGFPVETKEHAVNIVRAAIEMQNMIIARNNTSKHEWKMRAGVHSGNIVAGVVGKIKYSYDVWGNTVNLASKMERHSIPGKINVTAATFNLIKDEFDCEYRGAIDIPGNGKIDMYYVIADKSLNVNRKIESVPVSG